MSKQKLITLPDSLQREKTVTPISKAADVRENRHTNRHTEQLHQSLEVAEHYLKQLNTELDSTVETNSISPSNNYEVVSLSANDPHFKKWYDIKSSEFAEWVTLWNSLKADEKEFCTHPAWIAAWLRTYSNSFRSNFRLTIVKEAGKLVAVLPLEVVPVWAGMIHECTLHIQDRHPLEGASLAVRSEQFPKLLDTLFQTTFIGQKVLGLFIERIDANNAILKQSSPTHQLPNNSRGVLDLSNGYDFFLNQQGKHQRACLRRAARKWKQNENFTVEVFDHHQTIMEGFSKYCNLEARSWKGKVQTDLATDNTLAAFYRHVLKETSWHGESVVLLFRINKKVAAGLIGTLVDDTLYIHKISYDEQFAKISPGNLLLEWTAREFCAKRNLNKINLVTNSTWQNRWNPIKEKAITAAFLPNGLRGCRAWLRTFPFFYTCRKKVAQRKILPVWFRTTVKKIYHLFRKPR